MTTEHRRFATAVSEWAGLAAELLDRARRADLALSARSLERRVGGDMIRVLVAGDFKQGKSSLVNAVTGGEPCSTEIAVPTAVPTVCHFAPERQAFVVERAEGQFRRRRVTDLEAQHAQEGAWPEALTVELGLPSPALEAGFEFVDCPPATGRQSARAASVDAARSADVVVMVSDATQALTRPELSLLTDSCAVAPTILAVTKTDLVPRWREVLGADRRIVEEQHVTAPVLPVAARLHRLVPDDRAEAIEPDAGASGLGALLDAIVEQSAAAKLEALDAACDFLVATLSEARDAQARELAVFGDRERLRERVREAEAELERCESLRRPSAGWQRMLDARTEEIRVGLFEMGSNRLSAVVHAAKRTVARIDPGKDWETFEPWLRDAAGDVVTGVLAEAELRVAELAREIAEAFADENVRTLEGFSRAAPRTDAVPVALGESDTGRVTRFVREGFATLGSTSGGLLAFATLGGVVSAAILAPLAAVIGAGLGGTAIVSDRRSEKMAVRQRAEDAIDRFGSAVADELTDAVSAGLVDFKVRTVDELIGRADELVASARDEVVACRQVRENSELARDRVAEDSRNIAEIDDLLTRIRRRADERGAVQP